MKLDGSNTEFAQSADGDINQRIARRVREVRASLGLTLEGLAQRSGVSRSMISVVERGESSATAAVLDKLAVGLGITLGALFEVPAAVASPLSRHDEQALWKDPASGYLRRKLSPSGLETVLELVEVIFPAGQQVSFDAGPRQANLHQQVWLIEGEMLISVDGVEHHLAEGDCLSMRIDRPTSFRNPTRRNARYLVAIALDARRNARGLA